jgi:hypothetical protein
LPDDGDMTTPDTQIVPCTDERLANLFVQPDPDNPVTPDVGSFVTAPPLYGIWMYDPRDNTQRPVVAGEEGFMFTEVVAADPKVAPPVVIDGEDNFLLDPTLADAGEGILNIRSVYDFDGNAIVDIATMADPAQTLAEDRPARFLRIEKAVSLPDDDLVDLDNTDFGITTAFGMKEIVSYAMIEPDGSVMTTVPANVALQVSVVDEYGKRITARHESWIQVRPGQAVECNGCHTRDAEYDPDPVDPNNPTIPLSHGRLDAFESAYAGAAVAGIEFPNTDPAWFVGEVGDTMAEVRARITCATDGCSSLAPSMNVVYRDVWTADPVIKANNLDIDYLYTDLTTQSPTTLACQANWQSHCRSIINYESIIHPIWSQPRPVFDDMGVPVIDPVTGLQVDNNCISCHAFPNLAADGVTLIPPAGQLELTDGLSPDEPDHFHAYRELLVTDNLQEVVNDALVDAQQQIGVDIDGNPILDVIPTPPPASVAGARASGDFFTRFEDPANTHYNILSSAERRLIAEWLDVGAQYYNNPFDVPQ